METNREAVEPGGDVLCLIADEDMWVERKFQVWEHERSVHKEEIEGSERHPGGEDPKQPWCNQRLFGCILTIEFNEQDCQIPAGVRGKAQVTASIKRLNKASGQGQGTQNGQCIYFLAPF